MAQVGDETFVVLFVTITYGIIHLKNLFAAIDVSYLLWCCHIKCILIVIGVLSYEAVLIRLNSGTTGSFSYTTTLDKCNEILGSMLDNLLSDIELVRKAVKLK